MRQYELAPPVQLMKYIVGHWISKPIYVAAELGIADLLAKGPRNVEELAQESQSHSPSLYRMMRALASVGIFSETDDNRFELTPMAEFLKTGKMRSIALMFNSGWSDKAWGCFLDSVKTGKAAFELAHGMSVADWLENNPRAAIIFDEANAIKAVSSHRAIIDVYDFSKIKTLADVGGGIGILMVEILKANPSMQGIILDRPWVIQKSKKIIKDNDLENRCRALDCDFFESLPYGSDAYLMSNILHDWSDEQCRLILSNCSKAMKIGSKLLVMEMIIPARNEPSVAKLLDLEMLVTTGGRERTEAEFEKLFELSGFRISRIIPTQENVCIIESVKEVS